MDAIISDGFEGFQFNKIDVYGVDQEEKSWSEFSGKQQGDPEKLSEVLVNIAEMEQPPLHLLLGPDTYDLVLNSRKQEAVEFEQWRDITLSTDID